MTNESLDLAEAAVARAMACGADAADSIVTMGQSLGVSCRQGKIEDVERAENRDLDLRVLIGKKQAFVSALGARLPQIDSLVERAMDMARVVPEDPFCGLADASMLAKDLPALDLCDTYVPETDALIDLARQTEDKGRHSDGITNSEGAGAGWGTSTTALVTSHGFAGTYESSHFSLSCSLIAGEGETMQRDYASHNARHFADLDKPDEIGEKAAKRSVERLHPRKIKSCTAPVMFAPRIANSLLGHLAGAMSGSAIARGTSFLREDMGKAIFPSSVHVIDDPHRKRGLRSFAFDAEGLCPDKLKLVEDGVLQSWLLDCATAQQLGLNSNARAGRSSAGPPAPSSSNLYFEGGSKTPADLRRDMGSGLYVTELIGMGVNGVTGDYSRGAAGFWIENGEITYPVSEVTIAGNLRDMFSSLICANDLSFRRGTNSPSLLIEAMAIAGL